MMDRLKQHEDPQKGTRNKRINIEGQNKNIGIQRKGFYDQNRKEVDSIDGKILEMAQTKVFPEPLNVRRNLRREVEQENRQEAQRRKSILNKDSIAEQEIINNVYIKDAPNSVHLNPTATRKEIIKNISDENQKIMNNKKNNEMNDRRKVSRSVDFGYNGTITLQNHHYRNEQLRNDKYQNFYTEMKNDVEYKLNSKKENQRDQVNKSLELRKKLEDDSANNKIMLNHAYKDKQKKYVEELNNQMTDIMDRKKDKFKMSEDIKAMNMRNLQAYKNKDDGHNFASVPGWGENKSPQYQKQFFQKVKTNPKNTVTVFNNNNNGNIFNTSNAAGQIDKNVHYGMSYFLGGNEQLFYQVGNGRTQKNNFRVNAYSKSTDNSIGRRNSNPNQKIDLQKNAQNSLIA